MGKELKDSATAIIATSKGIDSEGRQRIRKFKWQKEKPRLTKLIDEAKELSHEILHCLTIINTALKWDSRIETPIPRYLTWT